MRLSRPRAASRRRASVRVHGALVPLAAKAAEPGDLRLGDLGVERVELDGVRRVALGVRRDVAVHPDLRVLAGEHHLLEPVGLARDLRLDGARLDALDDPAHPLDPLHLGPDPRLHLVGQRLDEVGARQGIDRVGDARLLRADLHRAEGDELRLGGRDRVRLVVRREGARLAPRQRRREAVVGAPHDVVLGLLHREAGAAPADQGPEHHRPGILRAEALLHHAARTAAGPRGTSRPPRRAGPST